MDADGGVNPLYLAVLEAGWLNGDLETITVLRVYCVMIQRMSPLPRRI